MLAMFVLYTHCSCAHSTSVACPFPNNTYTHALLSPEIAEKGYNEAMYTMFHCPLR